MKNLIWDLAIIVRDAFDAGRHTVDYTDYEPPAAQFQRVTTALKGETLTLALDVSDAREAIDKARNDLQPAIDDGLRLLKSLGFTFDVGQGRWFPSEGVTYSSMHEALRAIRDKATNNEEMSARCRCHAESARWHEIVTTADRAVNGAGDNTNDVGKLLAKLRDIASKARQALNRGRGVNDPAVRDGYEVVLSDIEKIASK